MQSRPAIWSRLCVPKAEAGRKRASSGNGMKKGAHQAQVLRDGELPGAAPAERLEEYLVSAGEGRRDGVNGVERLHVASFPVRPQSIACGLGCKLKRGLVGGLGLWFKVDALVWRGAVLAPEAPGGEGALTLDAMALFFVADLFAQLVFERWE